MGGGPNLLRGAWRYGRLYGPDWAAAAVLVTCDGGMQLAFDPFEQEVFADDAALRYPMLASEVPTWLLALLCVLVPAAAFALATPWWRPRRLWALHNAVLALVASVVLALLCTDFLKLFCGQPRPDFLARLATGDAGSIREGRLAFPSGHASISMAAMATASLVLMGRMRVFDARRGALWKLGLALAPVVVSVVVGGTRYRDNHHTPADIACGWGLGLVCALLGHLVYFAPAWGPRAGRPHRDLLRRRPVLDEADEADGSDGSAAAIDPESGRRPASARTAG